MDLSNSSLNSATASLSTSDGNSFFFVITLILIFELCSINENLAFDSVLAKTSRNVIIAASFEITFLLFGFSIGLYFAYSHSALLDFRVCANAKDAIN